MIPQTDAAPSGFSTPMVLELVVASCFTPASKILEPRIADDRLVPHRKLTLLPKQLILFAFSISREYARYRGFAFSAAIRADVMSETHFTDIFSQLWNKTLGDERICIAVLDGPVDRTHDAFEGAKLSEVDGSFAASGESDGFASQHATHVASVIFGQHGGPVQGIAPQCSGLLVPIFGNSDVGGTIRCSQVDLARAISMAIERGANIINISGGEFTSSGSAHPILGDVLNRCDQENLLVVAAAGNEGCDCLHLPAAHPSILAVGASNTEGLPLESSNWGSLYREHGLLAIGESVTGAFPGGDVVERSGTSCATAVVSGAAGLLMSLQLKRGETPNGPGIRELLLQSSDPCDDITQTECQRYLSGRLNVERAISLMSEGEIEMAQNQTESRTETLQSNISASRPVDAADSFQSDESAFAGSTGREEPVVSPSASPNDSRLRRIAPSACACGDGTPAAAQLVFSLGQLGFSFNSEARIDSFRQHMFHPQENPSPNPYDAHQLLEYLDENPWDASSMIWTLNFDLIPVYAIAVAGPYAMQIGEKLREYLSDQIAGAVERVSIPGLVSGRVVLMTGEDLPVIYPEIRGMYSWNTTELVKAVVGEPPAEDASKEVKQQFQEKAEGIRNFLDRVYYELRNLGQTSSERAINYSATNAFEIERVYESAVKAEMELENIVAEPSPHCRIGSDCWDVKLTFFFPQQNAQTVKRAYRFTVDVSDIVPVTVGPVREWSIPAFGGN